MGIIHALKTVQYSDNVVVVDNKLLLEIQSRLLQIMKDIAEVCEKENIKWSLSGGSVIGAVRHKGFIPWDDDIDIFMERSEFEKFKLIFSKYFNHIYELKLPGDKGYLFHFPQIHDRKSKIKDIQSVGNEMSGLFIDIFILENTYDNVFLRTLHGVLSTCFLFIDSCLRMNLCKDNILKYTNNDEKIRKALLMRSKWAFLFKFISFETWLKLSEKCFSKVKRQKTKYVVCPSGGHHFFGEIFYRNKMTSIMKAPFETEQWFIPIGYDYYLTKRYGKNYMDIPKESERERHIYAEINLHSNITEEE